MIYEQLLPSKGTNVERIKRLFQIIGFLHFLFGFIFTLFLVFIYWKFALITLAWGLLGFVWGSIAYLFSFEYKYTFKDSVFTVYKLNSNNKFMVKLTCMINEILFVNETKAIKLTNQKEAVYISVNDTIYSISPDDYMLALIKQKTEI